MVRARSTPPEPSLSTCIALGSTSLISSRVRLSNFRRLTRVRDTWHVTRSPPRDPTRMRDASDARGGRRRGTATTDERGDGDRDDGVRRGVRQEQTRQRARQRVLVLTKNAIVAFILPFRHYSSLLPPTHSAIDPRPRPEPLSLLPSYPLLLDHITAL